jgi:hypothetical protein
MEAYGSLRLLPISGSACYGSLAVDVLAVADALDFDHLRCSIYIQPFVAITLCDVVRV